MAKRDYYETSASPKERCDEIKKGTAPKQGN